MRALLTAFIIFVCFAAIFGQGCEPLPDCAPGVHGDCIDGPEVRRQ